MKDLLSLLNSIYPLSEELYEHLSQIIQCKNINAKEFLLKEGTTCKKICFIEKGLFRCYYNKNGKEVGSWFKKEGDIIISVISFFDQVPSIENIQALEDAQVFYITFEQLEKTYARFRDFNINARLLLQHYYKLSILDGYAIRNQTATERFQFMFENNLDFVARVPDKYMAAYLGMDNSTYCRSKSNFLKNQMKWPSP